MKIGEKQESEKKKNNYIQDQLLSKLDQADQSALSNSGDEISESKGSFEKLYEKSMANQTFKVGDVVKGRIVDVDDDHVLVDINYKSEGLIPKSEFQGVNGIVGADVGVELEVYIENIENEDGMLVLSKDRADIIRVWEDISQIAKNQKIVEGTVISKVKGGLHVDIGKVKAFLPGSQIDIRSVKNLDDYVGKTFSFKIIKFNQKRGNIVLSRRVILQEKRDHLRSQALDEIKEGAVVEGMVKNITDYGAFLDLGGLDGLLHIADISWVRIKHPSEKLSIGQNLKVKILKFDKEKNRVSLGLKQLNKDNNPWEQVKKTIQEGGIVKGRVTSITDYGAFVSIKEGVEGLVHVSEMSWGKKVSHPSEILSSGDEVDLKVIGVDHDHQRISFSIKKLQDNPSKKWIEKYPSGSKVEAKVQSITDFGIFVSWGEENISGLIRSSDLSWSNRSNTKSKYQVGDKIEAVVIGFNEDEENFQLSVKQLQKNPWDDIESLYPIGSVHKVKVVKIVDFGAFISLGEEEGGVEGLIHISELSKNRIAKVEDAVKVGDVVEAEIITMDKDSQKIGLSTKLIEIRKDSPSGNLKQRGAQSESTSSSRKEEKKESFFAKALRASISKGKSKDSQKGEEKDAPSE